MVLFLITVIILIAVTVTIVFITIVIFTIILILIFLFFCFSLTRLLGLLMLILVMVVDLHLLLDSFLLSFQVVVNLIVICSMLLPITIFIIVVYLLDYEFVGRAILFLLLLDSHQVRGLHAPLGSIVHFIPTQISVLRKFRLLF